jgi:hypothetical protein
MTTSKPWAVAAYILVIGSGTLLGCQSKTETVATGTTESAPSAATATSEAASGEVAIKDPEGFYKPFSDPSITKPPPANPVFGNGQLFSFDYDGSKSKEGDSVFYTITCVKPAGAVINVSNGSFDGTTRGTFSTDKKIYDSACDGRPGFIEVSVVQNAKIVGGDQGVTGKNLRLGVYPIQIESAK